MTKWGLFTKCMKYFTYMSIMGDLGPFSEPTLFSGDMDSLRWLSLIVRWCSLRSLCEPIVEDLDLEPSDSLSDISWILGEDSWKYYLHINKIGNVNIGNIVTLLKLLCIGRLRPFKLAAKSSLDDFLFNSWSNEFVSDLFALVNIVPPPKYWFKNSDLQFRII